MMSDPNQILTDIAYLDAGLVPIGASISIGRDGDTVKHALSNLSPENSKKARRRFRKYFRKALAWEMNRIKIFYKFRESSTSRSWRARQMREDMYALQRKCGVIRDADKELSTLHMANRRRLVNRYLRHTL